MHGKIRFSIQDCWLGKMLIAATERGVCAVFFGSDSDELTRDLRDRFPDAELRSAKREAATEVTDPVFDQWRLAVTRLIDVGEAAGESRPDVPLDLKGTPFQQSVWLALQKIPHGVMSNYTQIANRIGKPKSVRAVANACGANPVSVVIPCHRVLRMDGSLFP